ncbi:MAG: hypothetical protein VW935_16150, partial [Novosphingobium sp.]
MGGKIGKSKTAVIGRIDALDELADPDNDRRRIRQGHAFSHRVASVGMADLGQSDSIGSADDAPAIGVKSALA